MQRKFKKIQENWIFPYFTTIKLEFSPIFSNFLEFSLRGRLSRQREPGPLPFPFGFEDLSSTGANSSYTLVAWGDKRPSMIKNRKLQKICFLTSFYPQNSLKNQFS